ncbi:hypothetical protein HN371_21395 [Candidatus Poribacteria bacterium]|nr:hypothetical protein [Candidatus Poribacteria bacterium]MBT5534123.1 hypothetical protein [Candidatus Poribacteria bacterium]MBT5713670.1 hypothetical protein [Candidatus Poribacteria bacterium]MBT7101111.1 hypothetical protein [Candidatus Poribacteria bacterium]MBT7807247.1 hypothetical protein [Candidatus Poribacteria bacterium]
MTRTKLAAVALAAGISALLIVLPSAFAGEEKAEQAPVAKEHPKEHPKEHAPEHPDAHRMHGGVLAGARLEVVALEHGDGEIAGVIDEFLPEGSRIAFHHGTRKLAILTNDVGWEYAHRLLEALDVPHIQKEHPKHGDDDDAYPGDEHEDDDAYPGDEGEGADDEDCDEYPEDGDDVEDDDEEASAGPLTKEALAVAIKAHIDAATEAQGGHFHIEDHKAGVQLTLNLDKVHEERLATLGDGVYFACSDFKATDGKMYDVDFFMADADEGLVMTELHVHKEDGVARYTWHENSGVWSRREVE